MIGIIGALSIETDELISKLTMKETETISGMDFVHGFIYDQEVVIARCGIGKVFAGICAQTMILRYKPDIIINTGIAGGLDSNMDIYDFVIADSLVQHDMDTTGIGDPLGMISGLGIIDIPCSKFLVEEFSKCAESLGIPYHIGKIASGDQFVSSKEKIEYIVNNFGAVACEMEGAAIAQVCYANSVDFIVIRCLSDKADEGSSEDYFTFSKKAADRSSKLVLEYLKG